MTGVNSVRSARISFRAASIALIPGRVAICVPHIPTVYCLLSAKHNTTLFLGSIDTAFRGETGLVYDGRLPGRGAVGMRIRRAVATSLVDHPRACGYWTRRGDNRGPGL
jgi:hypothetical protein